MSNASSAPSSQQRFWVLGAVLAYLLLVVLFRTIDAQELHTHWTTAGDLDFGYVLLLGALYFCWRNMEGATASSPAWTLLLGFVALCAIHWLASVTATKSIRLMSTALGVWFLVGGIFGWSVAKKTLFPIALLWVATPAWFLLISPLQAMSVAVNTFACNLTGITVHISDNYFHLSGGVVEIARGCAGLKYMQTFMALAIANICIQQDERWLSIIRNLALAAVAALIVNWVRIFVLINVAEYSGIDHPLMADHDMLGWGLFVPALLAYLYFTGQSDQPVTHDSDPELQPQTALTQRSFSKNQTLFATLVAVLVMIFASLSAKIDDFEDLAQNVVLGQQSDGERCASLLAIAGTSFAEPQLTANGCYAVTTAKSRLAAVSFFGYSKDYQNSKLVSSNNHFVAPSLGHRTSWFDPQNLGLDQGFAARTLATPDGSPPWLIIYTYQFGSSFVSSDLRSKLMSAGDRIGDSPSPRGAWRFVVQCERTDCSDFDAELGKQVKEIVQQASQKLVSNG